MKGEARARRRADAIDLISDEDLAEPFPPLPPLDLLTTQQCRTLELERDRLCMMLQTAEKTLRDTKLNVGEVASARLALRQMHERCGLWELQKKGFPITDEVHQELRRAATTHCELVIASMCSPMSS